MFDSENLLTKKAVTPRLQCTECGQEKLLSTIELDYSPTMQLFDQPLSPCPVPGSNTKPMTARASGVRSS